MSTEYIMEKVNSIVEDHINKEFTEVYTGREKIGLDYRCGMVYVSEDAIAVAKYNDASLQYYGGFEYVSRHHRVEIGDYVFYLSEDSRVRDHIDRYFGFETEEEDEE